MIISCSHKEKLPHTLIPHRLENVLPRVDWRRPGPGPDTLHGTAAPTLWYAADSLRCWSTQLTGLPARKTRLPLWLALTDPRVLPYPVPVGVQLKHLLFGENTPPLPSPPQTASLWPLVQGPSAVYILCCVCLQSTQRFCILVLPRGAPGCCPNGWKSEQLLRLTYRRSLHAISPHSSGHALIDRVENC